jgi:type 1 fimbria pilin
MVFIIREKMIQSGSIVEIVLRALRRSAVFRPGQLLLMMLMAIWAPWSFAAAHCSVQTSPIAFQFSSTISVLSTAPVGTLLGNEASQTIGINCTGVPKTNQINLLADFNVAANSLSYSGNYIIIATNVPGIGIRLRMSTTSLNQGTLTPILDSQPPNGSGNRTSTATVFAQLIVTGPVASGTISGINNGGTILSTYKWQDPANASPPSSLTDMKFAGTVTVTKITSGCTVTSPNVSLPTISLSSLPVQAATVGQTAFTLLVYCNTTATSVKMKLTDQSNTNNTTTILQNTIPSASGGAVGIGVQTLDRNGTAITLGTQNVINVTLSGSTALQFSARYYRTAATGAPTSSFNSGTLSAYATIDLFYN